MYTVPDSADCQLMMTIAEEAEGGPNYHEDDCQDCKHNVPTLHLGNGMLAQACGKTFCVSHYSELLLGTSGSGNLPPCHDANSRKISPLPTCDHRRINYSSHTIMRTHLGYCFLSNLANADRLSSTPNGRINPSLGQSDKTCQIRVLIKQISPPRNVGQYI